MIRNLIYGAIAAGAVATVAVTAVIVSSDETKQSHKIEFDANGGTFSSTATCWTNEVNLTDCMSNVLNDVERYLTWPNHDLLGWATNKDVDVFVDGGASVAAYTNSTLFAKWKLSDIQKFDIDMNGRFEGSTNGVNFVEAFPAAFYGHVGMGSTNIVRFTVPETATSGLYRVSLDPQTGGWNRVCATITITQKTNDVIVASDKFKVGEVVSKYYMPWKTVPVNFGPTNICFHTNAICEIGIEFEESDWNTIETKYVLGIGLGSRQVRFDAGVYGNIDAYNSYTPYECDTPFRTVGANLTTNLPFGFLPDVKNRNTDAKFVGWFTAKVDGEQLTEDALVGTNEVYYAHWDVPDYEYTVKFNRNGMGVQGEEMPVQYFTNDVAKALYLNRYYYPEHRFLGWSCSSNGVAQYSDGQVVKQLLPAHGRIPLYAVWEATPGENHYTVSRGLRKFNDTALSADVVTLFVVNRRVPTFFMTVTNDVPVDLRVSLDPEVGHKRINAKLCIDRQYDESTWSNNVFVVSDLATNEVRYAFTNATYRFRVTGIRLGDSYVIGLGRKGFKVDFDSCGVDIAEDALSFSSTFAWSTNSPYGYLPKLCGGGDFGEFLGWFDTNDITVASEDHLIAATNIVVSNAIAYAHWSHQRYYVAFSNSIADVVGQMGVEERYYGVPKELSRNRYYCIGKKFEGWTTNLNDNTVIYEDCAIASNLCSIAGVTNWLYAVWSDTPGTNHYIVSSGVTNFTDVVISNDIQTLFHGSGVSKFTIVVTNANNAATNVLRVSLDPEKGYDREGKVAKLYVDYLDNGTNWEKCVCVVSDLATNEVAYAFTNGTYRFVVSADYPHVVGLGLEGAQISYDSCGVKDMTFNMTVDSPIGYGPELSSGAYGDFLGWYYEKDIAITNKVDVQDLVKVGTNAVYAHWENFPYYVAFSNNAVEAVGEMGVQPFKYDQSQKLNRSAYCCLGYKFNGWATNENGNVVYKDSETVSNLCSVAGATNWLYAVWTPTPGTNHYVVSQSITNFEDVCVSSVIKTFAHGDKDAKTFTMAVTNDTENFARVSLDPEQGNCRAGAMLSIVRWDAVSTNWSTNVFIVSDLATNEVTYAFTNGTYRFVVSAEYSYVVGLGLEGMQIDFDPCVEQYENGSISKALSFNWTIDSPFGYLPALTSSAYGDFKGWYKTKDIVITNDQVFVTNVVSAAETFYAHWANQPYYVAFSNNAVEAVGKMEVQEHKYDHPQALSRNAYYRLGCEFKGWATSLNDGTVIYEDCATVTNLCSIANETNWLYAVWTPTPGTNHYVVSDGVTNFTNVVISNDVQTLFHGLGSSMFVATMTNVSDVVTNALRVSLDPEVGCERVGAVLAIDQFCANGWANVCTVSDLATSEVTCAFTNATYRFCVTNVTAGYAYVIGLGREGAKVQYCSCVDEDMSFNWTVGSPIGYLPELKSDEYGDFKGWWYEKDITSTNRAYEQDLVGAGTNTVYAHWSKFPYEIVFKRDAAVMGIMSNQLAFYSGPVALNKNLYYWSLHRFAGWTAKNGATTVYPEGGVAEYEYDDGAIVTNLCNVFGGEVSLYSVWETTPTNNDFTVLRGMTNFENVCISPDIRTSVHGGNGLKKFCMTFTNDTESVLRVSLDPEQGYDRAGAVLYVDRRDGDVTNWVKSVCVVSDLATNEVTYAFTNGTYRFNVSADYPYVMGLNLPGATITFDPCDGEVDKPKKTLSDSLTFNWTIGSPFGYLPSVKSVLGEPSSTWLYDSPTSTNNVVAKTDVVTGDTTVYAYLTRRWYWAAFDGHGAVNTNAMAAQFFEVDVPAPLNANLYYRSQHEFAGWTTNSLPSCTNAVYEDCATVSNLCKTAYGTNTLYAVWKPTPGTNWFEVSQSVTNIEDVTIGNDITTFVMVPEGVSAFTMSMSTGAALRVSLDPLTTTDKRKGAVLCVDKASESHWTTNVCSVSDLSTNEVCYAFDAHATYRFRMTNVTSGCSYLVGLGRTGYKIDFDARGGKVTKTYSDALTFNWSEDSVFGYLPTVTADSAFGAFQGWFDTDDISILFTNVNHKVLATDMVDGALTAFAHWANRPYYVAFDGSGAGNTKMSEQLLCYNKSQALSRNQYFKNEHKFLGWATDAGKTNEADVVYTDCQVVSNLCSTVCGTTTLYAVWLSTPGTNWYYVAGDMTSFESVEVSPSGNPTYFVGKGDAPKFLVTTKNVNDCRIAIDPVAGGLRTKDVSLTVSSCMVGSNKWTTVRTVSALEEKEVTCSFTTNYQYKFEVKGVANTNGYVVSIGAEGARYIFDACGGYFADVTEKQTTTMLKFYNWTVGSPIGYLPTLTTNKYVHGRYEWHYTPLINETNETTLVCTTNAVVSGGDRIYAIWPDSVIVGIVFDWNMTATNVVFTNYYAQGNTSVDIYNEDYVRQPTWENHGFLGWTTNKVATANDDWDVSLQPMVTTNSPNYFYAQWTDKWKTSRTTEGLSIDGYFGTLPDALVIPDTVEPCPKPVVAIGDSAFTNCLFTSLSLPNTLTSIGSSAFMGCSAFATLKIWNGVTYVGDSAFEDCTALTTVTFEEAEMPDEYATEGFLDGIFDGGTPTVELGACLFKGCTALKDVDLPLGVNCIPDECFSGCSAMTSFADMPYTVIEIGTEAFAGCTHLTNVVFTEIVNTIGSGAFKKCARLKFVSFIGDQPDSVESDIFEKTPRNVLVRYLANMCATANSYCGGSWPALPSLWPEAGATNSSKTLTWLGGKYPRRKVIFNHNDNDVLWKSTQTVALYHEGRVFGLLAPTEDEMNGGVTTSDADDDEEGEEEEEEEKSGFMGWYTQPMGGRKIGSYWEVPTASEGDSAPITVYAHWGEEDGDGAEAGSRSYEVYWPEDDDDLTDFSGFYTTENDETGGDDMFYYSACTFNGIVYDVDNNAITGTVTFAFEDATYPEDGGMESAFKATVTWNTGKTMKLSGVADAEGYVVAKGNKWSLGEEEGRRTVITKSGLNGWLIDKTEGTEYRIYAARNRTAQATDEGAARTVVLTGLQATKGTWHVVLAADNVDELSEGAGEFANGYSTLSITIANMGQATITGTLGDGTAVNTSSTLIIGDGCCCLPVNIRPYGGKGGFAFMLWFTWQSDGSFGDDEAKVVGLTGWDASISSHPFTAGLELAQPLTFIDEKRYEGDATFDLPDGLPTEVECEDFPDITIDGKTWVVPSSDSKLKLSYNASTGLFSGSFAVECEGKKSTAAVNGAFTDFIEEDCSDTYHGYGTAVIKGEGSAKVEITTID